MRFLKRPIFWVVLLILVNLLLGVFIFTPPFLKNPNPPNVVNNMKKDIVKNRPGSCLFLREEYCNEGHIEEVDIKGKQYQVVGFRLPVGTEIYNPFDAEVEGGTLTDFQWRGDFVVMQSKEDKSESVRLFGGLNFTQGNSWNFSKGDTVAIIKDEGITNIDNYNLLILMTKESGNEEFETNTKMLNSYFPNL